MFVLSLRTLEGVSEIMNNFGSFDRYMNLRCGKYSPDVPGSTDVFFVFFTREP